MLSFRNFFYCVLSVALLAAAAPRLSWADDKPSAPDASSSSNAGKLDAAAIMAAITKGPAKVALGDQAVVDMPADMRFLQKDMALKILERSGSHFDADTFYGIFIPSEAQQNTKSWIIVANFVDSGFVRDDDQTKLDADKMLEDIKKATDENNEERKERGIPGLEVIGWVEKPHYDAQNHKLISSLEVRQEGSPVGKTSVNYNTFALGRGGYIKLDLVTPRADIEADKPVVTSLLGDLHYNEGKKYENFDPKTDKVAEYGLIALVGGIAAKHLGLFAVAAAFILKAKAVIVAAAAGAIASIKKFFRRRDPTV